MSAPLNAAALGALPAPVRRPSYDRARVSTGVVHLGPGAFHRAHQAALIDRVLETDPRWAITAIALRSRGTTDALTRQDGLYSLKTLGAEGETRVIGSIRRALSAAADPAGALAALSDPATRLITLTITEKGYCLDGVGALDTAHPDIIHDVAHPGAPRSAPGWLAAGLARRKALGIAPPVMLSCDNLDANGVKLGRAVADLARLTDPDLADWIEARALFPRTMVDSITPASDYAFLDALEAELGVRDDAAVKREVFTSWVIEAVECEPVAVLGKAGAVLTQDVAGHAPVKLRVLNGAHSALAWLGLATGHDSVADAMADQGLREEIKHLIYQEIMPGLTAPDGIDLDRYATDVLTRFAEPAIHHRLSQIACDSSQKLPVRLLGTVADNLAAGRSVDRLGRAVAAWMRVVVRAVRGLKPFIDPLAEPLTALARTCNDDPETDAARFLTLRAVFSAELAHDPTFRAAVIRGYRDVLALERGARP